MHNRTFGAFVESTVVKAATRLPGFMIKKHVINCVNDT